METISAATHLLEDVMTLKLSPKAMAIARAVLDAVKSSTVEVIQISQQTHDVPETMVNGILQEKPISLANQYRAAQAFCPARQQGKALYMHNKSLIEVLGPALAHKLYSAVEPLSQDVLVNYPLLYVSDNPKSSSDVLVGTEGSWSPVHQDLPLYCTSAILVLEGHKEFVVLPDEVVASLPVNVCSGAWEQPFLHRGVTYPTLQALVSAVGGAVLALRSGDMMIMPPRVFHLARNRAFTVSCNFSVCALDSVPLIVSQTLTRIEMSPRDVMHFDKDFARLLHDCTQALLAQAAGVTGASLLAATQRRRLPGVHHALDSGVRLMEWYLTLQCIPRGWVGGFWGEVRDGLLSQLLASLPLHTQAAAPAPGAQGGGACAQAAAVAAAAGGGKAAEVVVISEDEEEQEPVRRGPMGMRGMAMRGKMVPPPAAGRGGKGGVAVEREREREAAKPLGATNKRLRV